MLVLGYSLRTLQSLALAKMNRSTGGCDCDFLLIVSSTVTEGKPGMLVATM